MADVERSGCEQVGRTGTKPVVVGRGTSLSGLFVARSLFVALLFAGTVVIGPVRVLPAAPAAAPIDFGRDVLPLLRERCFRCHAGRDAESGVRLDDRRELLGETTGLPLVVVGRSDASRLIDRVAGRDPARAMPPPGEGEPLDAAQVARLRAWIDQGLKWDDRLLPPPAVRSDHWAFQPLAPLDALPPLDALVSPGADSPVDALLAELHRREGVTAAPEAGRATLLRRLSFDLTGLPPDSEQVAEFLADESPDAWSRQVDRLLADPAYGERWGRHWLDVARWAESEGYESNHLRPYAWRYRDFVVRAFNRDLPYDRFLRLQIAGDESRPLDDEALIATGFLAGARLSSNEEDKRLQRTAVLVDIVNMVGEATLGLTFGCAQCHNHKFDPITQRDYYRLLGYFVDGQPLNARLLDPDLRRSYDERKPPEYEPAKALRQTLLDRARTKLLAELRAKLPNAQRRALERPAAERTEEERALARQAEVRLQLGTGQIEQAVDGADRALFDALQKKIAAIEKELPDPPQTWAFYSPRTAANSIDVLPMKGFYPLSYDPIELRTAKAELLVRGDVHRPGPTLDPGLPEFLAGDSPDPQNRSALVDWLVAPDHPLTARVWANRVWQHHFGRGIVETSGDFGVRGAAPVDQRLLDFLASKFMGEDAWSTKRLQRRILLSAAYRRSSTRDASTLDETPRDGATIDGPAAAPYERAVALFARRTPRRLESEALRDALLAVAGRLDRTVGGAGQDESTTRRRTLYVRQLRDRPPEIQRLFDGPSANEPCSRRHVSTVALQSLYLLNHPLSLEAARAAAAGADAEATTDERRIEVVYRRILGRAPAPDEASAAARFLSETQADGAVDPSPLALLCQTLFNLNEFVYVE